MGTNYYAKQTYEGPNDEGLHIGKSSAGWAFALRIHPEKDINSLRDWINHITTERLQVWDEYGEKVSLGGLVDIICNRKREKPPQEFSYGQNQAVENPPNHLIRARLKRYHHPSAGDFGAVSHEATWDTFDHEFS